MSDEILWKHRFATWSPLALVEFAQAGKQDGAEKWALEVLDEKLRALMAERRSSSEATPIARDTTARPTLG